MDFFKLICKSLGELQFNGGWNRFCFLIYFSFGGGWIFFPIFFAIFLLFILAAAYIFARAHCPFKSSGFSFAVSSFLSILYWRFFILGRGNYIILTAGKNKEQKIKIIVPANKINTATADILLLDREFLIHQNKKRNKRRKAGKIIGPKDVQKEVERENGRRCFDL